MTPTRPQGAFAGAVLLALAGPACAQPGAAQPGASLAPSGPARPAAVPPGDRCAEPRGWLAAEETTPGILQRLAREAVAACEAQAASQRPQRPQPSAPGR